MSRLEVENCDADALVFLFNEYGLADDSNLTPDATALKHKVLQYTRQAIRYTRLNSHQNEDNQWIRNFIKVSRSFLNKCISNDGYPKAPKQVDIFKFKYILENLEEEAKMENLDGIREILKI